jgi:heptosyltransferase-2
VTKSVLLIPKGFLGDILLTTPVIAALKQSTPDASIVVLCSPSTVEFVRRDPLVSEVIVYDRGGRDRGWKGFKRLAQRIREKEFDVAVSFHRSPRTALLLWLARVRERVCFSDAFFGRLYTRRVRKDGAEHEVLRNLSLVHDLLSESVRAERGRLKEDPSSAISWADVRVGNDLLLKHTPEVQKLIDAGGYIVLSPGSAWETKRWHAEGFREVARSCLSRGLTVAVVGAGQDTAVSQIVSEGLQVLNLCGQTSLDELVAIVKNALCVVCNDSLALHICSATKTPVVAIFCATSPRFGFGPWRNRSSIVEKAGLFCKPCHRHGSRTCPTGTRLCMTGIDPEEVVCAVSNFLGEQERSGRQSPLRVVRPS